MQDANLVNLIQPPDRGSWRHHLKVSQVPPPDTERRPMSVSFLNEQQRYRYGRFVGELSPEQLSIANFYDLPAWSPYSQS
jgi:hypothetical protein